MTFSIVARCPETGQYGVAAVTAVPAVGKLLTHAAPGIGAVATQAKLNPYIGIDGIALLREGRAAGDVVRILSHRDPKAELRQFAVIDRKGDTCLWTGAECLPWAGGVHGRDFSVQGNRLTGEDVVSAAAERFEASRGDLSRRLIAALEAGEAMGGDRKGERSSTIYIVEKEEYPLWDIRVDAHPDPLAELKRLHGVFERELLPEIRAMPTRENPGGRPEEHQL